MRDYGELIGRVKAATGPDRKLDAAILAAFPPEVMASDITVSERWDGMVEFKHSNGDTDSRWAAYFTASIDAALALVERLLPLRDHDYFRNSGRHRFCLSIPGDHRFHVEAYGATAPLAILAALLSALSHVDVAGEDSR
jgi:hypothetical protein